MSLTTRLKNVIGFGKTGWHILCRDPRILLPFLCIVLFQYATLLTLFFAPRPPFSIVLAPVIRAFWGDQFLHYPYNFLLLPQLYNYAKNIIDITFGVFFIGIAVSMITQSYNNARPEWALGIQKTAKRLIRLILLWLITIAVIVGILKFIHLFSQSFISSIKVQLFLDFLAGTLVQVVFAFAIPAVIIENRKLLIALKRTTALCKNYPLETLLIVGIPSMLFLPLLFIDFVSLMKRFVPEITLY